MTCELCKKTFKPFKIPYNGHELESTVCRECWQKKREEYKGWKPPKTKKVT